MSVLILRASMAEIGYLVGYLLTFSVKERCQLGLIGGKLLENQTIVDIGLTLVDSCWNTYASTT